ncbi:flagellin lysine-N-methylase [Atlantibacter hermannii]|uniref:flagellin lysine-N-methylase n=1 Tax=Atlantibacter hermannii TaxID=565 RepID=UPI0020748A18|nr:flagellin lysine-N-methylase [Atlantibacter hermannii]
MREIIVSEPSFVSSFRCTGSACRDHCCKSWSISIDKHTVKKYTSSKDMVIKTIADESIHLIKKDQVNWGVMRFSPTTGNCPFLDTDRLCLVHKNLGADALSHTCSVFPRVYRNFKNEVQHSLNISCPEVASIIINDPQAMNFNEKIVLQNNFNVAPALDQQNKLLNLFSLSLISSTEASAEESLYALIKFIMFIQKTETLNDDTLGDVESVYSLLNVQLSSGEIANELKQVNTDKRTKSAIVLLLQDYFGKVTPSRGSHVLNLYIDFLRGAFCADDGQTLEQTIDSLETEWGTVYERDFKNDPVALKNFILYKLWHNDFPNNKSRDALQSLYMIVAEFYFVKILSAAFAKAHGSFDSEHLVNIIYSLNSLSQHNQAVAENFYQHIETVRLDDDLSMIHLLA